MSFTCSKTTQLADNPDEICCNVNDVEYRVLFVPSVEKLPEEWSYLSNLGSTFVQKPYLRALEAAPPTDMKFGYLLFFKGKKMIGLSCLQTTIFKASSSLNDADPNASVFKKIGEATKKQIAKTIEVPLLIGGNTLVTGENAYYFLEEEIAESDWIKLWKEGLEHGQRSLKRYGTPTTGFFLKDFFEDKEQVHAENLGKGFINVSAQPNMIFHLRKEWETYDDYLAAMTSKYRKRARSASRKGEAMERRQMDEKLIEAFNDRIHELYEFVATNAGFNLFILHPNYFLELKRELGNRLEMTGYFVDNQLVGFNTLIYSHDDLDAHFVGYDPHYNKTVKVYMNMLYDMIRRAIEVKAKDLIFARTAMEIKSSAGAVGYPMSFFLKSNNWFINSIGKSIYNLLEPEAEWVARSPFGKEN